MEGGTIEYSLVRVKGGWGGGGALSAPPRRQLCYIAARNVENLSQFYLICLNCGLRDVLNNWLRGGGGTTQVGPANRVNFL